MINKNWRFFFITLLFVVHFFSAKGQTEYIVTVNPTTGAFSKINSIPGINYLPFYPGASYNQTTKEYTVMGMADPLLQAPRSLFTINSVTGITMSNPVFPNPNSLFLMEYSRTSGILYGIVVINNTYYLANINKVTGTYSVIGVLADVIPTSTIKINEANQTLYVLGSDSSSNPCIYTFDLSTANTINKKVLTKRFYEMQYNNLTQKISGVTFGSNLNTLYLSNLDPLTGIVTDIALIPSVTSVFGSHGTINENSNTYFFISWETGNPQTYLFSVSIATGAIISKAPIVYSPSSDNLIFFKYDNNSEKLYALHWESITNPIPVTLGKLDAVLQGHDVMCKWQTLQEINSRHFIIERSYDAVNYTAAGTVDAAGNSSIPRDYLFKDFNAILAGTKFLYYRLKMTDTDGKFTYSNTVKLNLKKTTAFNIYPNPIRDQLTLNFYSQVTEEADVSIWDPSGRNIYKRVVAIKKGDNSILIDQLNFPAGVYMIKVDNQEKLAGKFIKL